MSVLLMLREFIHVKQESGPGRRRWFEAEGLELILWLDSQGAVDGYQICYDLGRGEHALTWRPAAGFSHHMVDTGFGQNGRMTPILVRDGVIPWLELNSRFAQHGQSLEPDLRDLVARTLAAQK